jgi:hypothetical protein
MWGLETRWFDVAVVMGIFAIGGICFGRFEEHKPRWRRVLKVALVLGITLALATWGGRGWAYGVLLLPALGAAYVHLIWLPKRGVNGWTAEPRERYLELVGARKR